MMQIMDRIKLKFIIKYLLLILPHYGTVPPAGYINHLRAYGPWRRIDDVLLHRLHSYRPVLAMAPPPGPYRRSGSLTVAHSRLAAPAPQRYDTDESWPELGSHRAWAQLEQLECGESAADRIIGGTNAALGQFPWLVRLGYSSPVSEEPEWLCGGALITPRHVLTAAHCTVAADDIYKLSIARLGEYDVRTDPDCQLGVCAPAVQDRQIVRTITHPLFKDGKFHNDIAIVELDSPIQLHDYVSLICLPRLAQHTQVTMGEPLTVAGWGKMNMSTEERAEILQVVQVPLVPPETCDSFGRMFRMTSGELCAGAQLNKDACGGDSGGPLMKVYDTVEGPKSFLVGVVSFGPTVCGIKKPGVYSSVSHFLAWILDNII